jgi:hypothetical protein
MWRYQDGSTIKKAIPMRDSLHIFLFKKLFFNQRQLLDVAFLAITYFYQIQSIFQLA